MCGNSFLTPKSKAIRNQVNCLSLGEIFWKHEFTMESHLLCTSGQNLLIWMNILRHFCVKFLPRDLAKLIDWIYCNTQRCQLWWCQLARKNLTKSQFRKIWVELQFTTRLLQVLGHDRYTTCTRYYDYICQAKKHKILWSHRDVQYGTTWGLMKKYPPGH